MLNSFYFYQTAVSIHTMYVKSLANKIFLEGRTITDKTFGTRSHFSPPPTFNKSTNSSIII